MIIRGGVVLTMDRADTIVAADVRIRDGRIEEVGPGLRGGGEEIDARGCIVMPGLVQTHVHLCQSLMRGVGDDLDVMTWLDRWVWPLEQRLDEESMAASVRAGTAELLLSGTASLLSMESAWHTGVAIECAADLGARVTVGKALMDRREPGTYLVAEDTDAAWADLTQLVDRWHGADGGRIRVAVSPRAPSAATPRLWRRALELADERSLTIQTHVNECRDQSEVVGEANGSRDVEYLRSLGALGPRTVLAHCVWLSPAEARALADSGTSVAHCPGADLKLGSGIADVPTLTELGVNVGIGTDGAACNDSLDAFQEMRLAALVHRARYGATAVSARQALRMMITNGARALGDDYDLGRVEAGCRADVIVVEAPDVAVAGLESLVRQRLVYATTGADVRDVFVGGRPVVRDRALTRASTSEVRADAAAHRTRLAGELTARKAG